jgi:hypothetical protein
MAKRILVPLERTLESEAVVLLARDAGASVKLLHVAAVPEPVVDDDGRVLSYADQEMAWVEVDAMETICARSSLSSRVSRRVRGAVRRSGA